MKIFCKHDWKQINQFEIPSEVEIREKLRLTSYSWHSTIRKYINDYICKKCGKIKRFKEKTYST